MTTQHTPGPWRALPQASSKYGRMIVEHDTGVDCVTVACNLEPHDARLIAAAPDLLAALRAVTELATDLLGAGYDPINKKYAENSLRTARAEIARAEGNT